ncbi:MAG: hypothetical protein JWL75_94 [Parcubacteria group bacterium]|nr:hypothetical protein [Parcubacteria group bacterium]
MKTSVRVVVSIVVLIGVLVAGFFLIGKYRPEGAEASVRTTVTAFGTQLQKVSLLAPNATSTIADTYGRYVAAPLLTTWESDPSKAPGRSTSSPYPDHIDIQSVTEGGDESYIVSGSIILMTSNEVEHGGNAGIIPVTLTLQKQDGAWKIVSYSEGAPQAGTPAPAANTATSSPVTPAPGPVSGGTHPKPPVPAPTPTPSHLSISSISPSSGPTGTYVTLHGTGFTSGSQVVVENGRGAISNVQVNASGTVLTFSMPSSVGAYCKPGQACPMYALLLKSGVHSLSVRNLDDTTSNSVQFTLTSSESDIY